MTVLNNFIVSNGFILIVPLQLQRNVQSWLTCKLIAFVNFFPPRNHMCHEAGLHSRGLRIVYTCTQHKKTRLNMPPYFTFLILCGASVAALSHDKAKDKNKNIEASLLTASTLI